MAGHDGSPLSSQLIGRPIQDLPWAKITIAKRTEAVARVVEYLSSRHKAQVQTPILLRETDRQKCHHIGLLLRPAPSGVRGQGTRNTFDISPGCQLICPIITAQL